MILALSRVNAVIGLDDIKEFFSTMQGSGETRQDETIGEPVVPIAEVMQLLTI